MRKPRVTVGLAVYNGENYVETALRSLVEQDYTDLEVIVGDNASTDRTVAICEEFAVIDPRVRVLRAESNQGVAWNHNRLVHEARGEYFKWAAHDDRHKPSWLSACVDVLDEHHDVVLCYTNTIDIDANGDVIKRWPTTNRASSIDPIERFCDVMLNERQCFPFYGLMRTDILRSTMMVGNYSGSDHPMLAEIALRGRFVEITEPLFEHREHVERSVTAYPNPRDRIVLFRPNKAGRMSFPRWRMARDFVVVLARAPLGFRAKLRAVPAFASWAKRWWRALIREPALNLRDVLRARSGSARARESVAD